MKSSSKVLLRVALMLTVALTVYFLVRPSSLSDTQQIETQLESARLAVENRDAGGVLQVVSADYKDSAGLNNDQLSVLLRRVLHGEDRARVSVSSPSVSVQGDTATSLTTVTVRRRRSGPPVYNAPITFHWKREDGTRFLVVPNKVWRIVSADYSGDVSGEAL